jgi:quercetin dioxygenase-like cupin family protein
MMIMKIAAAAAVLFASAAAPAAAAPPPKTFESDRTMADQPIEVPAGPLQVNVQSSVLQNAGDKIPVHMHFWPRYVYVQSGTVDVTLIDRRITQRFSAGDVIVEPIGLWHKGIVVTGPVTLVSVEQVPPGRVNKIEPPACDCPPPRR